MYTRSYFQDDKKLTVPENYDGNAFREAETQEAAEASTSQRHESIFGAHEKSEECITSTKEESKKSDTGRGIISTFLEKLEPSGLFGRLGIFHEGKLDIGSEEILILGIALFLFFSEGRDIECALMLLFLLLIK